MDCLQYYFFVSAEERAKELLTQCREVNASHLVTTKEGMVRLAIFLIEFDYVFVPFFLVFQLLKLVIY